MNDVIFQTVSSNDFDFTNLDRNQIFNKIYNRENISLAALHFLIEQYLVLRVELQKIESFKESQNANQDKQKLSFVQKYVQIDSQLQQQSFNQSQLEIDNIFMKNNLVQVKSLFLPQGECNIDRNTNILDQFNDYYMKILEFIEKINQNLESLISLSGQRCQQEIFQQRYNIKCILSKAIYLHRKWKDFIDQVQTKYNKLSYK